MRRVLVGGEVNMKFVLWGCGVRGKLLLSTMEKNRVMAFVDSNPKLLGSDYNGIPIVSMATYLRNYADCFVIITTTVFRDEILKELKKNRVEKIFDLQRCPIELTSYGKVLPYEEIILRMKPIKSTDIIVLAGLTLFSVFIYDHLVKKGIINVFFLTIPYEEKLASVIKKSFSKYKFLSRDQCDVNTRILIMDRYTDLHCEWNGLNTERFYRFTNITKYPYKKMDVLKGKYLGKRCFVIGNGPSLRITDLDKLHEKGEFSFGVNRVYRSFSLTKWRPTFYCWCDAAITDRDLENIKKMKANYKFIGYRNPVIRNKKVQHNVFVYPSLYDYYEDEGPDFSANPNEGVFAGATVLYECLQLAIYMGFKEIYIIGADCNYSNDSNSRNYFIDGYRNTQDGKAKLVVDKAFLAYEKARQYAEQHDVKIYNATRDGKLEVFERFDLDCLLKS